MAEHPNTPTPASITDEAARWVAEGEGRALSAREQEELAAWLAADPAHRRAYDTMQALWAQMGAVPETPALRASLSAPGRQPRSRVPRARRVRRRPARQWVAGAIAASLAVIMVGTVQDWPTRLQADAITETGETREVALPDGSRIHLGTGSAVAYDFGEDGRDIRLLKGEALFTVAPDALRPFRVEAGNGSTTALGTQFLVRRDDAATRVTVTEHSVRVRQPAESGQGAVVREGQAVSYGSSGVGRVEAVDAGDAIAWTEGALVFKDTPLAQVVAEIGRYRTGYLRVTGAARDRRVSGVFHIDDPDAAIEQLRQSFDLDVARFGGWLVMISD